jgi:hypothetical protein
MATATSTQNRMIGIDRTRISRATTGRRGQDAVGQRVAAAIAGLNDAKQIGRYARDGGPEPHGATERRLREGYKVVRMLVDAPRRRSHSSRPGNW